MSFDDSRNGHRHIGSASMQPPPIKRAKKAPTLNKEAWAPYQARVLQLHITEGRSLKEVAQIMERERGFKATERQYRIRISEWKKDKNVKHDEMQFIVQKRQYRKLIEKDKLSQRFQVRGKAVPTEQIDRWMRRHNINDDELYQEEVEMTTPSAIVCRTVSSPGASTLSPRLNSSAAPLSPRNLLNESLSNNLLLGSPSLSETMSSPVHQFAGQSPAMVGPNSPLSILEFGPLLSPISATLTRPLPPDMLLDISQQNHLSLGALPLPGIIDSPISSFAGQSPTVFDMNSPLAVQELPRATWQGLNASVSELSLFQDNVSGIDPIIRAKTLLDYIASTYSAARVDASRELQTIQTIEQYETAGRLLSEECLIDMISLGDILVIQARFNSATAILRHIIVLSQRNHSSRLRVVRWALISLGWLYYLQGRYSRAELRFRKALSLDINSAAQDDLESRTKATASLALMCKLQGKFEEAESFSLQVLQTFPGPAKNDPGRLQALIVAITALLGMYLSLQDFRKTEELIKQLLMMTKNVSRIQLSEMIEAIREVVCVYQVQGRYAEASNILEEMITNYRVAFGEDSYALRLMLCLVNVYRNIRNVNEAVDLARAVLKGSRTVYGDQHPVTSQSMTRLAVVLGMQHQWEEANQLGEKALHDLSKVLGPQSIQALEARADLGYLYQGQQRSEEAYPLLRSAIDILGGSTHIDESCLHRAIRSLLEICTVQERWDEIVKLRGIVEALPSYRKIS